MEIRKFRSEYNLELIKASHEGIILGNLVWDPILGPPEFAKKGMPNTIYTAFLDADIISKSDWETFRKENREAPLKNAHFATRQVDVGIESIKELQQPKIHRISADFLIEKLSKFTFSDLQMRAMDDLMRIKIDRFLEQMKASRWKEYDGSIRRVFLITELYYGTIRILIEKQFISELEASMKKVHMTATGRSEGSHAVEYEFSHDNVPFAMRIERVRTFNG